MNASIRAGRGAWHTLLDIIHPFVGSTQCRCHMHARVLRAALKERERERESCSLSLRARRSDTGRDGDAHGGSSTGISPWLEPNLHATTGAGAADLTNVARGAARSATTLPPLTRGARRLVDGYLLRSLSRRILLSPRALRSFLLTSVSAVAFALSRARART